MNEKRRIELETAAEEAKGKMGEAFQARFDMYVFLMIGTEAAIAKYYGHTRSETCTFCWAASEDDVYSWAAIPDIRPRGPWMGVVKCAVDNLLEESLGEDGRYLDLG